MFNDSFPEWSHKSREVDSPSKMRFEPPLSFHLHSIYVNEEQMQKNASTIRMEGNNYINHKICIALMIFV